MDGFILGAKGAMILFGFIGTVLAVVGGLIFVVWALTKLFRKR